MSSADKLPRWYFGGLASALATCITHPLDLLKVHLQTQEGKKINISKMTINIVRRDGIFGLYNGLSASLLRQLTYATARFGIYDHTKQIIGKDMGIHGRILVAGFSGGLAGLVGTPTDKVNVRMQSDVRLPKEKRYNYKHVLDGLWQIYYKEGVTSLFGGGSLASGRAVVMNIGTIATYDQIKTSLIKKFPDTFEDTVNTHLICSFAAAVIATTLTQPVDVLKTRVMNSPPEQYKGILDVVLFTAREGPLAFYKGYLPAFCRILPQTIIIFLIYEQLRIFFGIVPK